MARVDTLLAILPASLRGTDDEEVLWRGVLGGVADLLDYLELRRDRLTWLLDAARCPDDQVRSLGALVGLDAALPAAAGADVDTLRRLIPVALDLWRQRGSAQSWRDVARQLGGGNALIVDWFYARWIEGAAGEAHLLPSPGTAPGGSAYDYPEVVTDLWVADPDVDLAVVATWLDVVRPVGERINVRRALLVEDGLARATRWSAAVGSVVYDDEAHTLTLAAGTELEPVVDATAWASYRLFVVATWSGTSRLVVYGTVDDGYHLLVTWATGAAELLRMDAGVPTSLATAAWPTADGQRYRVSVEAITGALVTTLRARWEGLDFEVDDVVGRLTEGGIVIKTGGGGGNALVLESVLVYAESPETVRVGPDP